MSHSTPRLKSSLPTDVAMRTMGMRALRLMERVVGGKSRSLCSSTQQGYDQCCSVGQEPYYEASGTKSRCCCHMDA